LSTSGRRICGGVDAVRWAVDISGRASTLLVALLVAHGRQVVYVPGRTVGRMTGAYKGEGKTDAEDARVIADQARMRRDFASLVGICPASERAFGYSSAKGPVVMLTDYQTLAALRRIGVKRLATWLERRKARGADAVAAKAVEAARSQQIALPGEKRAAKLVCDLAHQLLALDEWIKDNDRETRETFRSDERAEITESMPGTGPILGAEFVAIVGDLSGCRDAGRLASHSGLAPVARDSGRRTGNYQRPKRYNRRLRHIFYISAQAATMRPGPFRDHYLKKHGEGLPHTRALLSLARRRIHVLWAMLRDGRLFTSAPPVTQAA
jgi:transposase